MINLTKEEIYKEFIIKNSNNDYGRINSNKIKNSWLEKHEYKEFFDSIYKDSTSISEKIYRFIHNVDSIPICSVCWKPSKFKNWQEGYSNYCSKECSLKKYTSINVKENQLNVDDEKILSEFIDCNGKIIKSRTRIKWCKEHGFYDFLINRFHDFPSSKIHIAEVIFRIKNKIENYPVCPVCGKKVTLRDTVVGYNKYCSSSCCSKDPNPYKIKIPMNKEIDDQLVLDLCLTENGNINPCISEKWLKEHRIYEYIKSRYNDSFSINETIYRIKNKIDKHPICNVCGKPLKYYGFSNGGFPTKYCISCHKQSDEYKEKVLKDSENLYKDKGLNIKRDKDDKKYLYVYDVCEKHNPFRISRQIVDRLIKNDSWNFEKNINFCPICNLNSIESKVSTFLEANSIIFKEHDRKILNGKELDFLLCDNNVAIECNGVYWHRGLENKEEIKVKYNICKENGIILLNFWEPDIIYNFDKVSNIINLYTNNISNIDFNSLNIKKCETISEISNFCNINKDLSISLNSNDIHFKLYYEDFVYGILECSKISKFRYELSIFFKENVNIENFDLNEIIEKIKKILEIKNIVVYFNHDFFDFSLFNLDESSVVSKECYQKSLYFKGLKKITKKEFEDKKTFLCYNSKITRVIF